MTAETPTLSLDGSTRVALRSPTAHLRVVAPPELRARVEVTATPLTVGRQPGPGAFAISHPTVSRRHAEVAWDLAGAHQVRDLGSRHGTEVDGTALGAAARPLRDGDVVRLGDVFLVYELGGPDAPDAGVDRDAVPGDAPAMAALRAQVARVAPDTATVLITGDTGTGKEWLAREVHRLSGRRGPLVPVNCATLTAQLADSQLFGHVKGAFTGATSDHDGWFRHAHGGTLFLDEVGELPLELQAKLLRVVQDGAVHPVGGARPVAVDVRLIAATNRDLAAEVERGGFRRDLLARLARFELRLPPLTARRGDLLAWLERLWRAWFAARDRPAPALAWRPAAVAALLAAPWPDNLRGVDRLIHDLALRRTTGAPIDVDQLPGWLTAAPAARVTAPQVVVTAPVERPAVPTREQFVADWERLGRSVRALARHYGRDRRQIYRWLATHGVRAPDDDGDA